MASSLTNFNVVSSRRATQRLSLVEPSRRAKVAVRAEEGAKKAAPKAPAKSAPFKAPTLDPSTPSPIFGGSTGGLLRKAQVLNSQTGISETVMIQVEEFYVITWEGKKEQIFEMPTGGAAIMRKGNREMHSFELIGCRLGPNLLKLARKEQCLALTTQLRTKFKTDACFYRVFPSGEVQYLHPKDGVYPEKVNEGREKINFNPRRIGQNTQPVSLKFTGKNPMDV